MPARTASSPATACPRVSSTGWAPPSSTGGPCAAGCAARPGPEPMAPYPAARPNSPSTPRSTSSGATTRPSPICTSSAASATPGDKGGRLVVVDPLRTKIAAAGGSASATAARHRHAARLVRRRGARAVGVAGRRLHRRERARRRGVHGAGARNGRRRGRPRPAACTRAQIPTFARWLAEAEPLVLAPGNGLERGRNGGSGIRAAIALPALLGKLGQGSGIVLGAGNAFPKTPAKLQRPDLMPGRHPHAQHQRYRPASCRGRHRPAAARVVHLQPQSDRRASRPEPDAPRARPRRTCSPSASS